MHLRIDDHDSDRQRSRGVAIFFSSLQIVTGAILLGSGIGVFAGVLLLNSGLSGAIYTASHYKKSYKTRDYLKETVMGGAVGLVTTGVGLILDAGVVTGVAVGAAVRVVGGATVTARRSKKTAHSVMPALGKMARASVVSAVTGGMVSDIPDELGQMVLEQSKNLPGSEVCAVFQDSVSAKNANSMHRLFSKSARRRAHAIANDIEASVSKKRR